METISVPEHKRLRSLRYSVIDGGFYASMVGFGEAYFIPLLLFVGATNYHVGVFSAAPQFFLAFTQFLGIIVIDRFLARKKIIVAAALTQIIFLALLFALTLRSQLRPWNFIWLAVGYFGVNGIIVPAWNSLIGDLTTPDDRGRYFGMRNGLSQLITFLAFLSGGLILQHFASMGRAGLGFAIIMGVSLSSRFGSVYFFSRHYDVPYHSSRESCFSLWQFLRRSPSSNFARFVFFLALMNFAVQMSAPFFVVYMLRDLGFNYIQYTMAQGVFIVVQFLAMRRWGAFSDHYGNRMVLVITGSIMPLSPLLWFLSRNYYYILAIQVFGGLAWGGWFLASANFIFDAVTPPKRARCAAYLNFFNSLGFGLGAIFGAWLSMRAPQSISTGAMRIEFLSSLQFIFLVSAAIRFLVVLLFLPTIKEVKEVKKDRARDMFVFLAGVRPFSGVRFRPFTGAE